MESLIAEEKLSGPEGVKAVVKLACIPEKNKCGVSPRRLRRPYNEIYYRTLESQCQEDH